MTTRFNVYFNGNESFKEGMKNIYLAHGYDDYTSVLPLYPISNHEVTSVASGQMDRAIEKAQKAEKLHSIRKKPEKKKTKRMKDPKYKSFLRKEEYNTQMSKVWLLHGKAQFHKGDFLAAVGTFTYITKHFTEEPKRVAEAKIWLTRSYAEMGWKYDAEEVISKMGRKNIPSSLNSEFAAAQGDLDLKNKDYESAFSQLKASLKGEKSRYQKTRTNYVLAQLAERSGNILSAHKYYQKAYRHSASFEMTFNSKIGYALTESNNHRKALRKLERMAENDKYSDGLDKIYAAMGDICLSDSQRTRAVECYAMAIDKSVKQGPDKINALIRLADLYYEDKEYLKAQPLYADASNLMTMERDDYERVSRLSQVLGELAQQNEVVVLQDSLQRLARMGEVERNEAIANAIRQQQQEEKEAFDKIEKQLKEMQNAENTPGLSTPGNRNAWYFYNPQTVAAGRTDFQRKWGMRKLEDNWRRKNKNSSGNAFDDFGEDSQDLASDASQTKRKNGFDTDNMEMLSMVNTDPQYYIAQLPLTPQQVAQSDSMIADALFAMGTIYQDKIEDIPMAIKTFEELERRFPRDRRIVDSYYMLFQMASKRGDTSGELHYRRRLIEKFPESSYAQVLRNPNYKESMLRLSAEQDSVYQVSYLAYTRNHFDTLHVNYQYMKEKFPLSPLMPKFEFLEAISQGKQGNTEKFRAGLQTIVSDYPESDVSAMAKSMLALHEQGRNVQFGSSHGSLLDLRDSIGGAERDSSGLFQFAIDRHDLHDVLILTPPSLNLNALQFALASYNFTGFLVKDFDISFQGYDAERSFARIEQLDNMEEGFWYIANLETDSAVSSFLRQDSVMSMVISHHNFDLLRYGKRTLDEYLLFYTDSILPLRRDQHIDVHGAEAQRRSLIEAAMAADKLAQEQEERARQQQMEEELKAAEEAAAKQREEIMRRRQERENRQERKNKPMEIPPTEQKPTQPVNVDSSLSEKRSEQNESRLTNPLTDTQSDGMPAVESKDDSQGAKEESTPPKRKGNYVDDVTLPHSYAILVTRGSADIQQVKSLFESYCRQNYPFLNLKVTVQEWGTRCLMTVDQFPSVTDAKNFMYRAIRTRSLFAPLRQTEYRSALISEKNRNELLESGDFDGYLEFNRNTYLK